jgi:hypothetical protein
MRYAIVLFLLGACICRAEEACPWINAATAAGVLGGEVTSHYDGSTCLFANTSSHSQLLIKVQTVSLPYKLNCEPNPTPLKAIGNEAVACSNEGSNNVQKIEQVAGRVRNSAFLIKLLSNDIPRAALREKARSMAEQVAGNLF